jgi:tryptophan synthase
MMAPTTTDARIKHLAHFADTFIYVVSRMGITGAQKSLDKELPVLIKRIRRHTQCPLAVGFGVSNREHFQTVGAHADGVVIGSMIVKVIQQAGML